MSGSTLKKIAYIMLGIMTVVLIPMVLVAIYSRPFADDFGYSATVHTVWRNSHSVIGIIGAMCSEVKDVYYSWQGSFSALALFSIQPAVFGDKLYGLSTVILLGTFVLGNYYFFSKVLKDRKTAVIIFSAIVILCTQTLPHAFQGFYWWNGASYYTLFYSLMLIQWGMLYERQKVVLPCILGFLLGGGNLVSGLLGLEVTVLFLITYIVFYFEEKAETKKEQLHIKADISIRNIISTAVILIFSAAGFAINILAPGNAVRAAESVSQNPLEAVGNSFLEAYRYFNEWLDLPLLLLLMFVFPFIWHYAKGKPSRIPFFVLAFFAYCLFASTFTPTLYSMSEVGPRRVQNIRYFVFVLFLVLMEVEACKRTRVLMEGRIYFAHGRETVFMYLKGYMLVMICGVAVVLGINTIPKENRANLTSIAALRSLLIGESRAYAKERDAWSEILESEDRVVTLPELYNHPVPIYYVEFDITGNPEDYRDKSMCQYYDKDMIILEKE